MRKTVEFLSAHTLKKEEDAADYSFKTKSQETDCAQSVKSRSSARGTWLLHIASTLTRLLSQITSVVNEVIE